MDLDLRDLELLDALGEGSTLTDAAQRLYVSQPALSQRLTKMEQRLGTKLFDRQGRKLVLNAAGRRMLVASRHVLAELTAARRDLRALGDDRNRRLRLTSQCSTTFKWLPSVIRSYRGRQPGVEVWIELVSDDDPIGALLDDVVDIALVTKADPRMDRVQLIPVFDDEMVAVVGAGHPWASRRYVTARDFHGVDLVIYDVYDPARIPAAALPIPHGARPGRITPMPMLPDLLVEMIAGGEGVAILPSWEADNYANDPNLVPIHMGAKPLTRSWHCATRQGPQPDHIQVFIDELTNHLAPVSETG